MEIEDPNEAEDLLEDWEQIGLDFAKLPTRVPQVLLGYGVDPPVQHVWLSQRDGRITLREWPESAIGSWIFALILGGAVFYGRWSSNEKARKVFESAQQQGAFSGEEFDPVRSPWVSALIAVAVVVIYSHLASLWHLRQRPALVASGSGIQVGGRDAFEIRSDQVRAVYQVLGKHRGRYREWDVVQTGLVWEAESGSYRMQPIATAYEGQRAIRLGASLAESLGVEMLTSQEGSHQGS